LREPPCRLYLITPPAFALESFADTLKSALDGGDVAAVQLRLKPASDDAVRRAAGRLLPIVRGRGIAFLLNDRADLAAELDCDGVHIGQEDIPLGAARKAIGTDRVLGVSCHNSRHLAMLAGEAGADYVAFGAFFPSSTKEARYRADTGLLEWWRDLAGIPCVAIGGITVENCLPLVRAGADFLAVSHAVWNHADGPEAAVKAFNRALKAAQALPAAG
jgi:thiamine-phosphate pyrophosphorylase